MSWQEVEHKGKKGVNCPFLCHVDVVMSEKTRSQGSA